MKNTLEDLVNNSQFHLMGLTGTPDLQEDLVLQDIHATGAAGKSAG